MWRLNCSCVCESSRKGRVRGRDGEGMIIFNSLWSPPPPWKWSFHSRGMSQLSPIVIADGFQIKSNLLLQVLKEKKPFTDWSNITGSAPCMMSLSPLTIHKPPQVCRSITMDTVYYRAATNKLSFHLPLFSPVSLRWRLKMSRFVRKRVQNSKILRLMSQNSNKTSKHQHFRGWT